MFEVCVLLVLANENCALLIVRMKCGSLEFYDKQYDRVTTKNEKRLQRISRIFHKVTTTDDPVIRQVMPYVTVTAGEKYVFSLHTEMACTCFRTGFLGQLL